MGKEYLHGTVLEDHSPSTNMGHSFQVEIYTASGQMMDSIFALDGGEKDLSKYTMSLHRHLTRYKTAYYSLYFPLSENHNFNANIPFSAGWFIFLSAIILARKNLSTAGCMCVAYVG
ncbi:hypothetical protein HHK36_002290 [Tetracentron sinense]|uniref:Uncharacterized protein n=1 Tax=Tetracentron sinense TaxID=13715 RepID=A0A835DSU3_TETSI|nr:hypothetical protein HHK36_002290 [Tetracentron sinense]